MKKRWQLIAAAVLTVAMVIFIWRNLGNQTRLRMIGEYQCNALVLMGLSFFAGMAVVLLYNLRKRWQEGGQRMPTRAKTRDEGL